MPDNLQRMADSQETALARHTVRDSPWFFSGAVLLGIVTCFYGVAPYSYLLASAGLGIAWFLLAALSWRWRSEFLRMFALLLVIFGQQVLFRQIGKGHHFEMFQGASIVISVFSALLMLLRRWLYRFSRLDEPECPRDVAEINS
jgi:hypothetical protein